MRTIAATGPPAPRGDTVPLVTGPDDDGRPTGGATDDGGAAELLARHRAALPEWLVLYYDQPIELVRGEGSRVWDSAGRGELGLFRGGGTTVSRPRARGLGDAATRPGRGGAPPPAP